MEVIAQGGGVLSVVLAGHPKLHNDLRRPVMEEIGYRTDVLSLDGLADETRPYLDWLLGEGAAKGAKAEAMMTPEAQGLLAARLATPLQIAEHLTRAFEEGFRLGQKPVTADIVAATLAPDFEALEPRLTRQGYTVRALAEQFNAKPGEIRHLLDGRLDTGRTRELADMMRAAGLPM
jgi:hypothetical protein